MNNPRGSFRNAKELLGEIQYAVEVGVREGKNSQAMLDAGCKRLICVDDYPECVEHWIEAKGPVTITREMQDGFNARKTGTLMSVYKLPATYCQIIDLMAGSGEPVIQHYQASRKYRES